MLPLDHVDVQLDLTGMELAVSAVSVEEYGMLPQTLVFVQLEIGMDSLVFLAPLVKHGAQQLFHAHAQPIHSGMV